ncbi:hypothetical protein ZTR_00794 [Talaromyces verruculosus]|nr:hypothetical protein ZTR_00794 [Talaromyces verruculosus]
MSNLRSTTPSRDTSNTSGNENNPLLSSSGGLVSELEQEVLDEYTRLLENVNKLGDALANLADNPASLTLDGLRLLERKTATVYTLLKASVYSIVLQQQIINDGEAAASAGGAGGAGDGGYWYQHDESGMQGGDEDTVMR